MDAEHWTKHLEGMTPARMAEMILADMLGYPIRGRHRVNDLDNLANAIEAIQGLIRAQRFTSRAEGRRFLAQQTKD